MHKQLSLLDEQKNIMNPDHPMWRDFLHHMNHPAGSNLLPFNGKEPRCDGTMRHTESILRSYPDVDVEASLLFFRLWGATCDCSVLSEVCWELRPEDWKSRTEA